MTLLSFRWTPLAVGSETSCEVTSSVDAFKADEEARKCGKCGTICDTAPAKA
jgi:3-hydroxyanthranilate 3,4-dioxygenase